jgi:hypothetical protein
MTTIPPGPLSSVPLRPRFSVRFIIGVGRAEWQGGEISRASGASSARGSQGPIADWLDRVVWDNRVAVMFDRCMYRIPNMPTGGLQAGMRRIIIFNLTLFTFLRPGIATQAFHESTTIENR